MSTSSNLPPTDNEVGSHNEQHSTDANLSFGSDNKAGLGRNQKEPELHAQYAESPNEAVTNAIGAMVAGGVGALVDVWEGTEDDRRWVTEQIGGALRSIGQYSQDRVKELQVFISEKSLERKEPGRPTAEGTDGEFEPPKKGATTGKVEGGKLSGKEGWIDKDGKIWVPTNGKDAHGGEHWDVMNKNGTGHYNVYPGGHIRANIDGDVNINPAVAALHDSIKEKVPQMLSQNGIQTTPEQRDNTIAKVFADVRATSPNQTDIGEMYLVNGKNGQNIITERPNPTEFSPYTPTGLDKAMNTPARDSYQTAHSVPPPNSEVAEQKQTTGTRTLS
jgi:hypothetical protein